MAGERPKPKVRSAPGLHPGEEDQLALSSSREIVVSLSSVTPYLNAMQDAGLAPPTRQKTPTASLMPASTVDEIREKGLSAWAHEQRMEGLKARLRTQILADKKISEQDLAGMPAEQRDSVEAEIQKLIEQKLKEALQKAVEDAAKTGKTEAVLVDIAV